MCKSSKAVEACMPQAIHDVFAFPFKWRLLCLIPQTNFLIFSSIISSSILMKSINTSC